MRLTNKLFAQHLGWTFKKHWQVQGKRVPRDTGAAAALQKHGIDCKSSEDFMKTKHERKIIEIVGYKNTAVASPNWNEKICHIYNGKNVLLEGLPQAQILTKTIVINDFPKQMVELLTKMQLPISVDRNVQSSIMSSLVFDAQQIKLPKVKLPDRLAYNLPRVYGISQERRIRLLTNKLIFECEKLAGLGFSNRRKFIDRAHFKVTFNRNNDLLQFDLTGDKVITSVRPIDPVAGKYDSELPDLFPIKCTITIPKSNIYYEGSSYPLSQTNSCSHPHTIFSNFNKELVGNLHETNVTESQFQSRTMLTAFAAAAARAKQLYGDSVQGDLSKPIVVQSIQTDGRTFHFGVFQMNTLDLDSTSGIKNYWFHRGNMELFEDCGYRSGRPYLESYNKEVIRCLNAFYRNS